MTDRLPIKRGTAGRLGLRHRSTPRLVIAESEGGDPQEFARHLITLRRATGGGT